MTELEKIEARIAELIPVQIELEELQTAARVLRRLSDVGDDTDARKPARKRRSEKSSRKTIREWAHAILQEKGELHFSEIADEAVTRGYVGRKNTTPESIRKAFWATMNRAKDAFVATGAGRVKLRETGIPSSESTKRP